MSAALAISPDTAQPKPARVATIRPAPRREPPFDDELPSPRLRLVGSADRELPFPPAAASLLGVAPVRREDLPDPATWARRLLVGLAESAAGRRPLNQVASLLTPSVYRGVSSDFERAVIEGSRHWLQSAAVRSVRVSEPSEGVAELAATVQTGRRVRALALRIEARHGHWRCTRLHIG